MKLLIVLALVLSAVPAAAAAHETRSAVPGQAPPPARVADLAWLEGIWEGEGLSGPAREVYSAPMGGQIAGQFTQTRGEGIWFYEIMAIVPAGNSIEYRLKHFNADLTGWEEKDEVQRFALVAVEDGAWYFDGLTIRRDGEDGMVGAVRIDNPDGTSREAVIRYRRVR